ncbi:MAG: hypothetical protein ACP5NX_04155 [Candidatus Bilamarchaeaceae archaeon]
MIHGKLLVLKQKQFFETKDGVLRLLGPAGEAGKRLAREYKVLHIVDMDAKSGKGANFDIYDSLTSFVNIQVECAGNSALAKRLYGLGARVVIEAGDGLDRSVVRQNLTVLKTAEPGGEEAEKDLGLVKDVLVLGPTEGKLAAVKRAGKRVFIFSEGPGGGPGKGVFCVIE